MAILVCCSVIGAVILRWSSKSKLKTDLLNVLKKRTYKYVFNSTIQSVREDRGGDTLKDPEEQMHLIQITEDKDQGTSF